MRDLKRLKFRDGLVPDILSGAKNSTWRLRDDKKISVGDLVECVDESGRRFAIAEVTEMVEKSLGCLTTDDFEGHERYETAAAMYATFEGYYGTPVGPDTPVKLIRLRLLPPEAVEETPPEGPLTSVSR